MYIISYVYQHIQVFRPGSGDRLTFMAGDRLMLMAGDCTNICCLISAAALDIFVLTGSKFIAGSGEPILGILE